MGVSTDHAVTALRSQFEALGCSHHGDQNGRMRLLQWLGKNCQVIDSMEFAFIGKMIASPESLANVQHLIEALAALIHRDIEAAVLARLITATDAEQITAAGHDVDH